MQLSGLTAMSVVEMVGSRLSPLYLQHLRRQRPPSSMDTRQARVRRGVARRRYHNVSPSWAGCLRLKWLSFSATLARLSAKSPPSRQTPRGEVASRLTVPPPLIVDALESSHCSISSSSLSLLSCTRSLISFILYGTRSNVRIINRNTRQANATHLLRGRGTLQLPYHFLLPSEELVYWRYVMRSRGR